MGQILYPIEDSYEDPLERFLAPFHFHTNGFGVWRRESRGTGVEGYICDYQIVYVAQGALCFSIAQQPVVCPKGAVIFFEPFVVYTTQALVPQQELHCYSIHFDINPEHRQKELVHRLLGDGGNVFLPQELPPAGTLFHNLFESRRSEHMGLALQSELELRLVCLYMLRARWPKDDVALFSRPSTVQESEIVRSAIAYIKAHISHPIRLNVLCQALNISTNYLYKCFMDVMGLPPSRYILRYKVRLAVEMLRTGGQTLEMISEHLGFSSPYHLSSVFKQIMGCSPREFIRESSRP